MLLNVFFVLYFFGEILFFSSIQFNNAKQKKMQNVKLKKANNNRKKRKQKFSGVVSEQTIEILDTIDFQKKFRLFDIFPIIIHNIFVKDFFFFF